MANALGTAHRRVWGRWLRWTPNLSRLELELTTACNLRCLNCNRATTLAPDRGFMTVAQVDRFVRESLELGWRWKRIALSGGEPTLHPALPRVVSVVERYKRDHPSCEVAVVTNGHGRGVNGALSRLPGWVVVKSSAKSGGPLAFDPFNLAPIDEPGVLGRRFDVGCAITEICGLGLSRHGLYPCGPAATVDRVFGRDLGLKSLAAVTLGGLRAQMAQLCGLCGHFLGNDGRAATVDQEVSASWQAALRRYEQAPPTLTPW